MDKKIISLDGHETATLLSVIRRLNKEREKKIAKAITKNAKA